MDDVDEGFWFTPPSDLPALSRTYAEDGVVLLRNLFAGPALEKMQSAVRHFRAAPRENGRSSVKHLPGRIIIRGLAHASADMRALINLPALAQTVAAIASVERVMCWNDLTLIYQPKSPYGESPWHHDIPAFPLRAAAMPSLWIALSSVDEDRSPLVFVPGSQKSGDLYPPSTENPDAYPPGYAAMPDWDALIERGEARRLWWAMQPGDCILLDSRVVHSTPANRNEHDERISLITRWFSCDAVWHRDRYSTPIPGLDEADWRSGVPVDTRFFD